MNKIFISTAVLSILALGFISSATAQVNSEALRYEPNINEDEIIVCTKDVTHKAYFGQLSCIITPADDILDKQTADKIYEKTQSLDDTFEVGLID